MYKIVLNALLDVLCVGTISLMIYQGQTLMTYCAASFLSRNVMHNLLEKIDSYLWTKKPNTLMPEVCSTCAYT